MIGRCVIGKYPNRSEKVIDTGCIFGLVNGLQNQWKEGNKGSNINHFYSQTLLKGNSRQQSHQFQNLTDHLNVLLPQLDFQ